MTEWVAQSFQSLSRLMWGELQPCQWRVASQIIGRKSRRHRVSRSWNFHTNMPNNMCLNHGLMTHKVKGPYSGVMKVMAATWRTYHWLLEDFMGLSWLGSYFAGMYLDPKISSSLPGQTEWRTNDETEGGYCKNIQYDSWVWRGLWTDYLTRNKCWNLRIQPNLIEIESK